MRERKITHANRNKKTKKTPEPWSEYLEKKKVKQAWTGWVDEWGNWDTACCWHVPDALRSAKDGWGKSWLENRMKNYFDAVDRRTFRGTPLKHRAKVKRYITLEHSDGVGWHAHGLVETPQHMQIDEFRQLLAETWKGYLMKWTNPKFADRLVYLKDLEGGYAAYSTKHAIQVHETSTHLVQGEIDLNNSTPT